MAGRAQVFPHQSRPASSCLGPGLILSHLILASLTSIYLTAVKAIFVQHKVRPYRISCLKPSSGFPLAVITKSGSTLWLRSPCRVGLTASPSHLPSGSLTPATWSPASGPLHFLFPLLGCFFSTLAHQVCAMMSFIRVFPSDPT